MNGVHHHHARQCIQGKSPGLICTSNRTLAFNPACRAIMMK
jgi:hypothetical protein